MAAELNIKSLKIDDADDLSISIKHGALVIESINSTYFDIDITGHNTDELLREIQEEATDSDWINELLDLCLENIDPRDIAKKIDAEYCTDAHGDDLLNYVSDTEIALYASSNCLEELKEELSPEDIWDTHELLELIGEETIANFLMGNAA